MFDPKEIERLIGAGLACDDGEILSAGLFVDAAHEGNAAGIEVASRFGQRDAARGAREEAGAELALEAGDVQAHLRLGHAQALGRGREAPRLRDGGESALHVEIDPAGSGHGPGIVKETTTI